MAAKLVSVCRGDAAEIALASDGHHLFASTRGRGSILTFTVDDNTGSVGSPGWTACQGQEPRFFALEPDGSGLHVANQDQDAIVSVSLNGAGQLGSGTVTARVGSPSAICFGGMS